MAYTTEIRVLKLVARWLGEGRPTAGQTRRDIEACDAHVTTLCSIRCARAWEVVFSVRMQTWVVVGRNAWLLSTHRRAVASHVQVQRANDAQFQLLRSVEAGYVVRIRQLEDLVEDLNDYQRELQFELDDLRRANEQQLQDEDMRYGRMPRQLDVPEPELDASML
jgi:hypothetical protein